jgi:hypothetical protein
MAEGHGGAQQRGWPHGSQDGEREKQEGSREIVPRDIPPVTCFL